MFLLDTNMCIYAMKKTFEGLNRKIYLLDPKDVMVSSITVYELEYGAEKSRWGERTRQNLALFLAPFTIIPFTADDAVTAGKICGYLERRGTPIGPYDIQIAAQGLARNLTVITHNTDEFSRVPSLKIEDWID